MREFSIVVAGKEYRLSFSSPIAKTLSRRFSRSIFALINQDIYTDREVQAAFLAAGVRTHAQRGDRVSEEDFMGTEAKRGLIDVHIQDEGGDLFAFKGKDGANVHGWVRVVRQAAYYAGIVTGKSDASIDADPEETGLGNAEPETPPAIQAAS